MQMICNAWYTYTSQLILMSIQEFNYMQQNITWCTTHSQLILYDFDTFSALTNLIEESCATPHPQVTVLDHLYDFKQWITPHLYGQFKHHTGPHCFRIKRVNDEVLLHHRQYTGDEWQPSNGLKCLKVCKL